MNVITSKFVIFLPEVKPVNNTPDCTHQSLRR
jgi:hypothetical protein